MLTWIRRSFVSGLGIVLPILVTVWLAVWFVQASEKLLGGVTRRLLPGDWYLPGTGVVLMLVVVFVAGVFAHGWLARVFGGFFRRLIKRIPMLGAIYDSLRDIVDFATGEKGADLNEVVLLSLPGVDAPVLGFVTGAVAPVEDDERIAVYLPMSYQIGGFTVFVERERCRPVDMTKEQAMRFALTAGIARDAAPHQGS